MMLLEYLLLLTGVLCCTAAPAADKPQGHCNAPPRLDDKELQGDWNSEYYASGTPANYGCYPGFSRRGSTRYICNNGKWEALGTVGQCLKKSCGYPGDIEFGTFELKNGDQFVFGVTVVYSCDEGYKMASKHKTRDCTATGWSGYLPHCEAVKCPPVIVNDDVNLISTSYDEEYTVNQVIRFECKNSNKKLRGASDIVCTPDGTWSAQPPNCEDIKCSKPEIAHGKVTSLGERFNKDQSIEYTCDTGYKSSRTPRTTCTETGWSPPPDCEEIICQKPTVRNGRILESKDYYSFQETVTLECNNGYVIVDTPKDPTMTCTSTSWMPSLQCISKKCDRPNITNGKIFYETNYFPTNVGGYFDYYCDDGYTPVNRAGSTRVYCYPNGWSEEPRCRKKCSLPSNKEFSAYIIRPGDYTYEGEKVQYQCFRDFKTASGQNHGYIECLPDGKVVGEKCIKQCERPELKNGMYKTNNTIFESEKYLVYECNKGYVSANLRFEGRSKCTDSVWTPKPECKELTCPVDISTPAENKIFKYGQVVHFKCKDNKTLVGSSSSQCFYYGWGPSTPHCNVLGSKSYENPVIDLETVKEPTCPHGFTAHIAKVKNPKNENDNYGNGEEVEIECQSGNTLLGSSKVRCENGTWQSSFWCMKKDRCDEPGKPKNGQIINQKSKYFSGETLNYKCSPGYHISGYENNTCMDQMWLPPPDCIEDSCEIPAPIQHGRIKDSKQTYKHGEKVTFECLEDYTLSGDGTAVCSTGQWLNIPTCVYSSCEQPPGIKNGQLKGQKKLKYKTGEKTNYVCNQGYSMSKSGSEVTCENKEWTTPPECRRIGENCVSPPVVQNGDIKGNRKLNYDSGSSVEYQCANLYILEGNRSIKCEDGEWEKAPICREPCTVTIMAMEKNNIQLAYKEDQKMYSEHLDHITFSCKQGYYEPSSTTNLMRVQCIDGVMPLPKCSKVGSCVLQDLEMSQRNIVYSRSHEIGNGETVVFECTEGTVAEGKLEAKCNNGNINYPNCVYAPSCELKEEEMSASNIKYHKSTKQIKSGQTIIFTCAEGMIEEKEESLVGTCMNGNIKYPKCVIPKPCNISASILEEKHIELVSPEDQSKIFQHDETINVKCRTNYKHPVGVQTKCFNGMVRSQKCFEKSLCRISQNQIDDNFLELNEKYNDDQYYEEGDIVRFKCKTGYSADNELTATCAKPPSSKPPRPSSAQPVLNYPTCIKKSDS